jgi:hypothetical protein
MKPKAVLIAVFALLAFVTGASILSEITWSIKQDSIDPLRQLVGLPSVAVGNLNPSARNPGLEILCTGLYDVPGGYCSYFTEGVPFFNFILNATITVSGPK